MSTQLACQQEKPPGEGRPSLLVPVSGWLRRETPSKRRCAFGEPKGSMSNTTGGNKINRLMCYGKVRDELRHLQTALLAE